MGVDKSSLVRNEVSMLSYSKQLLTDSGINSVVISGKTSAASHKDTVVSDVYQKAGPVGGIASIIQQCKPSALLILPVDLPLMTFSALKKLKHIGEISQQACFYEDNYLPLYLPVNAHVEQFLQNAFITGKSNKKPNEHTKNGPSIRALLNQIPHKALKIENQNALFNSNTPEQWKTAQASFSTSGLKN
jgi:molybdopterin-guanine dinucleotide biosynthesis protein A